MTDEEVKALEEALEGARAEAQQHLETLAARDERLREMEAEVGRAREELEGALGVAQAKLAARDEELASLRERMSQAVGSYRGLALSAAPEIPEEMVSGETIEEVDASLEKARGMVERVKRQLESSVAAVRVPAGAPPRTQPDLSSLSPREKIAYALARGQG